MLWVCHGTVCSIVLLDRIPKSLMVSSSVTVNTILPNTTLTSKGGSHNICCMCVVKQYVMLWF